MVKPRSLISGEMENPERTLSRSPQARSQAREPGPRLQDLRLAPSPAWSLPLSLALGPSLGQGAGCVHHHQRHS